jgi:hypothetical protein
LPKDQRNGPARPCALGCCIFFQQSPLMVLIQIQIRNCTSHPGTSCRISFRFDDHNIDPGSTERLLLRRSSNSAPARCSVNFLDTSQSFVNCRQPGVRANLRSHPLTISRASGCKLAHSPHFGVLTESRSHHGSPASDTHRTRSFLYLFGKKAVLTSVGVLNCLIRMNYSFATTSWTRRAVAMTQANRLKVLSVHSRVLSRR